MEKILAPMIECVPGKLVYQGAEDVLDKSAGVRKTEEFDCHSKINISNNARKSSVQFYQRLKHK